MRREVGIVLLLTIAASIAILRFASPSGHQTHEIPLFGYGTINSTEVDSMRRQIAQLQSQIVTDAQHHRETEQALRELQRLHGVTQKITDPPPSPSPVTPAAPAKAIVTASTAEVKSLTLDEKELMGRNRMGDGKCESWLKVYVYEFPDDLKFIQYAREYKQACRDKGSCASQYGGEHLLAQFSLELILHDFFLQSCVRTMDAESADLFFVPFYNDIEYRKEGRPNEPSVYGRAILDILERNDTHAWEKQFGVTGKYWRRKGGADHILTMSAPVTGFKHPKGMRGWGHYMVQLAPPIFLSIELTRSFIHEYPRCSSKNIVLPYPIPGKDWHNGQWRRKAEGVFGTEAIPAPGNNRNISIVKKHIFAYYTGGNHGCTNVREAISKEVGNDPKCLGDAQRKLFADKFRKSFPQERVDLSRGPPRQVAMSGSLFCACPEGDSPSAKRQYDALLQGCIPVLVSNEAVYAYSTENMGALDPSSFRLALTEESIVDGPGGTNKSPEGLLAQLRAVRSEQVKELQLGGMVAKHYYRFYAEGGYQRDPLLDGKFPDGGATLMLLHELEQRADGVRASQCAHERTLPHFYHRFQYCGSAGSKELSNLKRTLGQKEGAKRGGSNAKLEREITALQNHIKAYEGGWISR